MKKEKKTEKLRDALGRLPQDLIKESAEYDPAAVRSTRTRVAAIIAAAAIIIMIIPLGIVLSRVNRGPEPAGPAEDSTALFIQDDTTRNSSEVSSDPTPDITTQPSTGTEPGTIPDITSQPTPDVTGEVSDTLPVDTGTEQTTPVKPDPPVVIENPTAPSQGGGLTALSTKIPAELESLTVTAESGNSGIIPVNATFIVRTARPATAAAIASAVSVTPATAMSVTTISDTEFRLTPASGDLVPGKIYKFTLGDPDSPAASFSFQTEKTLAVTSILPANDSRGVPLNTGIEVAFTEAINPADASNAFSITPSVKGKTMLYPDGRTVAFIPDKALSYGTVYTVTVRAGVRSASGKTLAESKVAKFMTITRDEETQRQKYGNSQSGYLYIQDISDGCLVSPGREAAIKYFQSILTKDYVSDDACVFESVCDLYACPSAASAGDFWSLTESERYGTSPEKVLSKFALIGSYECKKASSDWSVSFGNELPAGLYVAMIRVKVTFPDGISVSDYVFVPVQITDLRTELALTRESACVWVVKTDGSPVQGAPVTLTVRRGNGELPAGDEPQTLQAVTGEDGAAVFDVDLGNITFNAGMGDITLVVTAESGDDLNVMRTIPIDNGYYNPVRYFGAVYTDRETYFSSDTVNFSGFITTLEGGALPSRVYLSTGMSALDTAVEVDENGYFTGSVSFEGLGNGYIYLRFADEDGQIIFTKMLKTTEEPKPKITASISFDKLYYRRGDVVNATLKASFFDGTPVSGIEFTYYADWTRGTGTTDEKGEIRISFTPKNINPPDTAPVSVSVSASLTGTELQQVSISQSALYFHSDYVLKKTKTDGGVLVELYYRDLSGIKTAEDLSASVLDKKTTGAPVDGISVEYALRTRTVVRTKKTTYDTYGKVTNTSWEYKINSQTAAKQTAAFRDGRILLPLTATADPYVSYEYVFTFTDNSYKRQYSFEVNCTERNGKASYLLSQSGRSDTGYMMYELHSNGSGFKPGDVVTVSSVYGGEPFPALFILTKQGIISTTYGDKISFVFTEEMNSGVSVYALFFNADSGRFDYSAKTLSYDFSQNSLEPAIKTDKYEYRPGETATVEISVPGLSEGTVVVSIVDEACFAIEDQTTGNLAVSKIFSQISNRAFIVNFLNHFRTGNSRNFYLSGKWIREIHPLGAGGDGPGEYTGDWEQSSVPEGTYVRKNFRDNPVFATVKTDGEGKAVLTFTVPDNITSWRVTAVALGLDGGIVGTRTGVAVSDTVCTLPFFVSPDCCEKYVEGDTVSAGVRAYGVNAQGEVTYHAYLVNASGEIVGRTEAVSDCAVKTWLRFEGVKEGRYKLTVYAVCGSSVDACENEFDVVKTAAAADITRTVTPAELSELNPAYYPVQLTISENSDDLRLYEEVVRYLSTYRGSGRTDEFAALWASLKASDLLYGTDNSDRLDNLLTQILQRYNYGDKNFKLLPYSEGYSSLTAGLMQAGLVSDKSVLQSLIPANYAVLASANPLSAEELCRSAAILAAAGEPVLDILASIESGSAKFSYEAKLWLAIAYCSAGDYAGARRIYSAVRSASAKENAAYRTLGFGSGSASERIRTTSAALMCAVYIDRADASMIARWLLENRTNDESAQLALAAYVMRTRPLDGTSGTEFEYTVNGKTERISLDPGQYYTLVLYKQDFESLRLDLADNAAVTARYRGEPEEAGDGRFSLEKTYEATGDGFCRVTLTLSGKSTRTVEWFEIYDLIPSGARFLKRDPLSGGDVSNEHGQNVTALISVHAPEGYDQTVAECPEYEFSVTLTYYVRAALEGDFTVESARAVNLLTGEAASSGRALLTIGGENGWSFAKNAQ